MYEIRLAQLSDEDALTRFIDEHWKKNHVFVRSKTLLDWQHLDRENGRYNFVIGVEPFSPKRVHVDYMTSLPAEQTFRVVKGDSDQDRPNDAGGLA